MKKITFILLICALSGISITTVAQKDFQGGGVFDEGKRIVTYICTISFTEKDAFHAKYIITVGCLDMSLACKGTYTKNDGKVILTYTETWLKNGENETTPLDADVNDLVVRLDYHWWTEKTSAPIMGNNESLDKQIKVFVEEINSLTDWELRKRCASLRFFHWWKS